MANYTPNLQLEKPLGTEYYDIEVHNENSDKIDTFSGTVVKINDIVDNLTTSSATQPLSAGQGKILQDTKANGTTQVIAGNGLTGGGDLTTDRTLNIVSANDGIVVNSDNIELKPATTSVIGGVKPDGTTLTVDINGLIKTVDNKFFTNYGIPIPSGTNLNTFLTKGHYTSVDDAITGSMFNTPFLSTSFTLVVDGIKDNNMYISQLATKYYDGVQSCRVTHDNGANWTAWTEIINKTTGDATYVKKSGDTMTGGLIAATLVATNGTNTSAIYATYNNLATDHVYLYNSATSAGINSSMPTHGGVDIFSRNKSTGVVAYAGGNYGTINGSTATFSGNVTAPSITIGGYVVTIV